MNEKAMASASTISFPLFGCRRGSLSCTSSLLLFCNFQGCSGSSCILGGPKVGCYAIMVDFSIESMWDWSSELSWKDCSNKVRVVKCMCVDQILIKWFMFDKVLLIVLFEHVLGQSTASLTPYNVLDDSRAVHCIQREHLLQVQSRLGFRLIGALGLAFRRCGGE